MLEGDRETEKPEQGGGVRNAGGWGRWLVGNGDQERPRRWVKEEACWDHRG